VLYNTATAADAATKAPREMVTPLQRKALTKEGYKVHISYIITVCISALPYAYCCKLYVYHACAYCNVRRFSDDCACLCLLLLLLLGLLRVTQIIGTHSAVKLCRWTKAQLRYIIVLHD
jgi:hypothetical protein